MPLSFAQQRLWFLEQLDPGNATYHIPVAYRLTGPLDSTALEQSLNEIVRRHAILRTTFATVDAQPVQVIVPTRALPLARTDLREFPEAQRAVEAQRRALAAAQQPFDLAHGPLVRATLLRLGEAEHVLVMTLHHIVADGWSLDVLMREVTTLYAAFSRGQPSPLSELPIQYTDFAVWQRQWLQGAVLETQLAYWRQQLRGTPAMLDLPTDYRRPPVQTFRGAQQALQLPQALTAALKALSQGERGTLFMTLLAAWKILLQRYTGQDDIVVGAPIAGRSRMETEGLIGLFLNTLVLRTNLSGHPSFRALLQRVREVCLGAYAHQELPFEKLLEELQPERSPSHTPLFQVFFNMLGFPAGESDFTLLGHTVEPYSLPATHSKFDLTLYIQDRRHVIDLSLVYNTDLFCEARMAALLTQFHSLLAQIVAHPDQRVDQFSLVTRAAGEPLPHPVQALSDAWEGAVHQRFGYQAQRQLAQLALVDPHETWTYGELDAHCNQLAQYLMAHGIAPENVVAIYGHRSAALVWAVMGVLRAGAAFLILDPSYPPTRLLEYLAAAQPCGWLQIEAAGPLPEALATVVTTSPWRCRLTLPTRAAAQARGLLSDYATTDPEVAIGPDSLSHIAFTSGSTGRPKGIQGRHGPLSHFIPWLEHTFDLRETDRFSMLSGLAFDPLQRDIYTPLQLGATLYIPTPEDITPGRLATWIQRHAISVVHLTPALGDILTAASTRDTLLPSLRYAFFVGDVLTRQEVFKLHQMAPHIVVVNYYGTTETSRAVGYYVVPRTLPTSPVSGHVPLSKERIPLGCGIQDVQLLVLNTAQQLAGIGEVGEIYVRSPHLVRGYLHDEALTHARFLDNPWTHIPGDRLYRTGDLGRYLPDGYLEFVGRLDHQIKLRGFRIELGEIEAILRQHPTVCQAVVLAREDTPGAVRLVAYVVPEPGSPLTSDGLRRFVQQKLPDYMVPSAFITLATLPLDSQWQA